MKRALRYLRRKWWVVAAACPLLAVGSFFAAVWWLPYPAGIDVSPSCSTVIVDDSAKPLAAFASDSGNWFLPLKEDQISPHLLKAIVAVEDSRFYQHGGIDWSSAGAALWQDVTKLSLRRGASTIDMQLYRLRDPAKRSLMGKLLQSIRACQIDRRESKQQILVDYLSRAPFGGNLIGAGAASWRYFGRPCAELSLGQAALLAGLPQSPNRFRPDRHPDQAKLRRAHVLERMAALGLITESMRSAANAEPLNAQWHPLPQDVLEDIGLLPTLLAMDRSSSTGTIRATIHLDIQQHASAIAKEALSNLASSHINAAAVVVLDTQTGKMLAAVSHIADGRSQIDLTRCARSSGSTLKPFIYAAGFSDGICSPQTLVKDSPSSWEGYEPSNYDHSFRGLIPASEALAESRNVPAIALLSKVGNDEAVNVLRAVGFAGLSQKPERYGLALAVGGAEVTPMELATAYATIARGDRGKSLPKPDACRQVMYCLADVERTRNIFPPACNLAPAWKTGTSSGRRDAWCAAVTPRRTVVVWFGNIDGSGSDQLIGSQAAAPVALKILVMADRVGDSVAESFAPPVGFSNRTAIESRNDSTSLSLVYPREGQQIVRDDSLATGQQKIGLRASGEEANVWWFVDGQCVGQSSARETFWWQPSPGAHEVQVCDASGRSSHSRFVVLN